MSSRYQPMAVSIGIGLLLPAVAPAAWPVIFLAAVAMVLWLAKVIERKDNDLLWPIIGLAIGVLVAVLTAPLLGVPDAAAVVILVLAVLM